jgi:hypothetical protein
LKRVPEYFHIGNRKENIALYQIRNEASNLNLHLYDHHLTDIINCPNCDCPCETPAHFFMHCPEYNNQRQTLKNTFTKLNINFNLQTILNGCETLNYHQNEELVLSSNCLQITTFKYTFNFPCWQTHHNYYAIFVYYFLFLLL